MRSMKVLFVLFPLLLFAFSKLSAVNACHEDEREILLSFKSLLTDPSNRLASWQGQNCCSWHGIHCSESLHVTTLDLRNPNPDSFIINMNSELIPTSDPNKSAALTGTIPPSLFSLTHISHLDLSFNNFTFSKIPSGLTNLTGLTYLNLSNTVFSDSITTQFSNLTSLTKLDLSCSFPVVDYSSVSINLSSTVTAHAGASYSYINRGDLSSSKLDWLQGLTYLEEVALNGVDLSEASSSVQWAKPISSMSKLEWLELSNCRISGETPAKQLLNLTNLSGLAMDFNFFTSKIPIQLANLTSLWYLDLTGSNLQGPVPHLPRLKELYLRDNSDLVVDIHSMFSVPWPQLEILDISSTKVIGTIPDTVGNITSLRAFFAYNCLIPGQIPNSMMNLSRLEILNLSMNNLNGSLSPSISNLKGLWFLSLLQNSIAGTIPNSICSLSSLEYIALMSNSLTGNLPDCIAQLSNVSYLSVGSNKLNGTIHFNSLFQNYTPVMIDLGFSGLTVTVDDHPFPVKFQPQFLLLDSCNLGGKIPDFIANLNQLQFLSFSKNSLSGTIPSWVFNLPNLGYLDVSFNKLEGVLPPNIKLKSYFGPTSFFLRSNQLQGRIPLLQNINALDLSENNFTGNIPEEIGLGKLRFLSLSENKLVGEIPLSFCPSNNNLMLLDLSKNRLRGKVPTSLGNCKSLIFLNLGENNLRGNLPNDLEGARNLSYLDISDNHFDGAFPSVIRKLPKLMVLKIGSNRFEGSIPQFIGDLQDLRVLLLEFNSINGSIPEEITNLEKLQIIGFSGNQLSGPIPQKLSGFKMLITRPGDGNLLGYIITAFYVGVEVKIVAKGFLQNLEVVRTYNSGIDLSCNNLSGNIPSELGVLQGLYMLNLSHNHLSGEIPSSISHMSKLESLDLSFNDLSGEIPQALTLMDTLTTLSLSYNNLSGKIPTGPHFDTLSPDGSAYVGNRFLCGAPNAIRCDSTNSSSDPETVDSEDSKQKNWLYEFVFGGYAAGLIGFFGVLYLLNERRRKKYWETVDRIAARTIRWACHRHGE